MVDRKPFTHGWILKSKAQKDDLAFVYQQYESFLAAISQFEILDFNGVSNLVAEFNLYRGAVLDILESRKNSGQENLRSTMLEEFFCHLFWDISAKMLGVVPDNFYLGKANAFVDLTFAPASFQGFFKNPHPYLHSKDQDFILGAELELSIRSPQTNQSNKIKIPFVAIECKTYIERNMLDSCSGTARRIKSAMPYCLYIVASEYMKLKDEQPELSDINEIYILCKASVSERSAYRNKNSKPHPIDTDLVYDLFQKVTGHLNSIWWAPEKALLTGKVINRP